MNPKTLSKAISEAKEFIKRAEVLQSEKQKDGDQWYLICGSALSGSVRRQSLELTRALADMRKSC